MVYEKEQDKEIWSNSAQVGIGHEIVVGIYQYGDSVPKIGMVRKIDGKFKALGRMRYEEVKLVAPLLMGALKQMESNNTFLTLKDGKGN